MRGDHQDAGETGLGEDSNETQKISDLTQAEGIRMKVEIIETPIRFHLHGIGGVVENERYAEVGLRLMNEMWQVVKGAGIPTGVTAIPLCSHRKSLFHQVAVRV